MIRAHVLQIPGVKEGRPHALGQIAFPCILGRSLQTTLDTGFDAVHYAGNFDSEEDVKAWFMYDVGVTEKVDRKALEEIPLRCYLAHHEGEDKW